MVVGSLDFRAEHGAASRASQVENLRLKSIYCLRVALIDSEHHLLFDYHSVQFKFRTWILCRRVNSSDANYSCVQYHPFATGIAG